MILAFWLISGLALVVALLKAIMDTDGVERKQHLLDKINNR